MKKIILLIFLTLTLNAETLYKYSLNDIQKVSKCIFKFNDLNLNVYTQIKALKNYPKIYQKIANTEELNYLYVKNERIKNSNFRKFKKNLKRLSKIYKKNNLEKKYNIPSYYTKALFNKYVIKAKSLEDFNKKSKKTELIEILINPLMDYNPDIIKYCINREI